MKSKNYTQANKSPKQETPKESKQQDGLHKIIPFFTLLNSKIMCVEFVSNFVTAGKLKDNTPAPGCSKQGYVYLGLVRNLNLDIKALKIKLRFILFVYSLMIGWPKKSRENNRVAKSSRLLAEMAAYLFCISLLLCLAFF